MNDEIVDVEAVEVGTELELRRSTPPTLFRTEDPAEVIVKATATAKPLAEVIRKQKLYKTIQGKNHVLVEGWTLLGSMLGVVPVVVWTHKLDNGWEARVEARTLDGRIVGAAEAQCLRTEARWKSADDYAIRSMAQTRATSRALRGPLGFVIQLAGFQPEPAEDMPGGGSDEPPAKKARGKAAREDAGEPSARAAEAGAAEQPTSEDTSPASPATPPQGQSTAEGDAGSDAERGSPAEESPFKPPAGPRGGQATLIEASELAEKLIVLVNELGAVDSLPMVEQKREAGDIAWLKRQITTASKALERRASEPKED